MTFKSLGLSEPLLKAVAEKGYETPSPIQEKAIPVVLEGKDILASAQTGTGKTAGFTLPILHLLSQGKNANAQNQKRRPIKALVLTPTRELAAQIYDNVVEYGRYLNLRSTVIFGGVNQNPQVRALRNGIDILIATPGRLLDLESQGHLRLDKVEVLVLDEADRMLDMGFVHDIKKVMAKLPARRQNLLFSATFSKEIRRLAGGILHDPIMVSTTPENTTAEKVAQKMYRVDKNSKPQVVIKMIDDGDWSQVLIFTRTKHGANRLSEKLVKAKITAAAIHGNKSQGARTRALADFKSGKIRVLVATDIAARGLDIPLLPHVINYELPNISEDYVHRIGRTGRAGASGEAISLVGGDEVAYVRGIEKLLRESFKLHVFPGFDPIDPEEDPPKQGQRGGRNKGGGGQRGGGGPSRGGQKPNDDKPRRSGGYKGKSSSSSRSGGGGSGQGGNSGKPKRWGSRSKTGGGGSRG